MTSRRNRIGFTLMELMAGLSVAGLALVGAVMLLDQLTDGRERISLDTQRLAREGNAARVLRRLLLDAQITADTADRFGGDEHSMDFSSLCDLSGGWPANCRANVGIDHRGDSSIVVAVLTTGEHLELSRHAGAARLVYLDGLATDSAWRDRWTPSIRTPAAIGILIATDTIVLPVGSNRD